jgi:hypothetical protein
MKYLFIPAFLAIANALFAQFSTGFPERSIKYSDLEIKQYSQDTAAHAVVLNEFGMAYIDEHHDNKLILEYQVKIKILTKEGVDHGNFKIPLRRGETGKEKMVLVDAVTYNLANNSMKEVKMSRNQVVTTSVNEYWDEASFTLPDVQVGSVIDVRYIFESPFIFNFYPWKFQSEIPKLRSEFWVRIPGNYLYNKSLRGFLKLSKNESSIVKDCFTPGPYSADCVLDKYVMIDIPSFVEEDFMTAKSNFIAGIEYELSEIKQFDGRVIKFTKTWKDVDKELNTHEDFGAQIKKGRSVWEDVVRSTLGKETDSLKKATSIYNFVKEWFAWNDHYGKYAELGVRKAYESRKGNVGDINLSLIAALQEAGLPADPVILATREEGLPNQLYPIISEFNYVVASLWLGGERILIDATDPLMPFGLLPERCLNGNGRLISKKEEDSNWVEIIPREKKKQQISINLKLDGQKLIGDMTIRSFGYEAYEKRSTIKAEGSIEKYRDMIDRNSNDFTIQNGGIENLDNLYQPLVEKFEIEVALDHADPNTLYLNPFLVERWTRNPFVSNQRYYPVDFGAPVETVFMLNLEYPSSYTLDDMPQSAALTLPQNGGRFLFSVSNPENKIVLTSIIHLSKVVYSPMEYHNLKELFNRIIAIHQSQIVFKKR